MKCIDRTASVEYCPQCRAVTTMQVRMTPDLVAGEDGRSSILKVTTYHCGSCRSFVRRIDEEGGEGAAAASQGG